MKLSPPDMKPTRFAQLKPGEVFVFAADTMSCVALAVADPAADGDMAIVPLGPVLPSDMLWLGVVVPRSDMRVISLGTNCEIRLPTDADGWAAEVPPLTAVLPVRRERGGGPQVRGVVTLIIDGSLLSSAV
jgi:hypothetical protein